MFLGKGMNSRGDNRKTRKNHNPSGFFRSFWGNSRNPEASVKTAEKHMSRWELPKAEKILLQVLSSHPNHISALRAIIKLYSKKGEVERAREIFDDAVPRLGACPTIYNTMLFSYELAEKPEKAREVFDLAVRDKSANLSVYRAMSHCYHSCGKFSEIEKIFESAPKEITQFGEVSLIRAEALRKDGKPNGAIGVLGSLLSTYPESDNNYSDRTYVLARSIKAFCILESGEREQAKSDFFELKSSVSRASINYPRILCGCVLSSSEMGKEDKNEIGALLGFYGSQNLSVLLLKKIETALSILKGIPEKPSS